MNLDVQISLIRKALLPIGGAERFILRHTAPGRSVLTPEIELHLATEVTALWQASEAFLAQNNLSPPFWAFAWPGSEALARCLADQPGLVAGLRVLDFAAGCGLAAIAAARAGASRVEAAEIDPLARAAIRLNAAANGREIVVLEEDIVGRACQWDVILAGDIFYEAPMTGRILPWLRRCARSATVIIADPGRAYCPQDGVAPLQRISVPTSLMLEDSTSRIVTLLRLQPDEPAGLQARPAD